MLQSKKAHSFLKKHRSVILIILIAAINLLGVTIFLNISKNVNIRFLSGNLLSRIEKTFHEYEKSLTNTLYASADILIRNEQLAKIFLQRDREKLFFYTEKLFSHIKKKNYFTHWYFLNPEPERTCFLRMHSKKKFGDKISRFTFEQCILTKKSFSGKELGKTAFAIRVVQPWIYKKKLIGYIELGVEIDSYFHRLKKITDSDIGLIVQKKFLDKTKWESVKTEKGERNNWDDNKKYLLINKTTDNVALIDLNSIKENIPNHRKIISAKKIGNSFFIKGLFPLFDASGKKVGAIFVLKDISKIYLTMIKQSRLLILLIFLFLSILTFFMLFFHKRAENELKKYRNHLEEMIEARTKDLKRELKARIEAEASQIEAVKLAERTSKMASLGIMAAGIAHEINQPLNAIKVSADSAIYKNENENNKLDDNYLKKLKNISDGVDRISEIILNMRNFWILPEDSENRIVDINIAVKDTVNLVQTQLNSNGIKLYHEEIEHPLKVKCALVHLEQIMVNLLSNSINSIKSAKKNEKLIRIKTERDGKSIIIKVIDSGVGLPDVTIDKLIDPFFSTGKTREGTGLGLAIINHYVKKYKGKIKTEENKYGGATFVIEFPEINN